MLRKEFYSSLYCQDRARPSRRRCSRNRSYLCLRSIEVHPKNRKHSIQRLRLDAWRRSPSMGRYLLCICQLLTPTKTAGDANKKSWWRQHKQLVTSTKTAGVPKNSFDLTIILSVWWESLSIWYIHVHATIVDLHNTSSLFCIIIRIYHHLNNGHTAS